MTLTYEQLQSWRPEDLTSAADELNTARKTLEDQQDEIDAGKPPTSWIGDAHDRAIKRHRKLVDSLNDLAAPVSEVINGLDNAASAIKKAKDDAKGAYDEAVGNGWKVTFAGGSVKIEDPHPDKDDPDKDKGTMDRLAQVIVDALQAASDADSELAGVLVTADIGGYDGGTGSIEQASLPPELRGLSDRDLIKRMMGNPDEYDGYTNALTPEQQAALGHAIGDEADHIRDADKEIPLADLKRLDGLLEAYGADPEVSTGFLNTVGPKGLLELNAKTAFFGGSVGIGDDEDARAGTVGALQKALGATLAAGTHDIGDEDPGSLSHVSTDWKWDMLGAGGDKIHMGTIDVRGFQALSPLLADGSRFDPGFLQSAGTSIVNYERNWDWDKHPEGPWDPTPGIMGDTVRLDFTQGTDAHNDPLGHDPIPGVLRGIADNPEAARGFFSSETTIEPGKEPYDSLVKYLMYDRADEHHIFNDFADRHPLVSPPLGPLGDALEAATLGDGADERSVGVVNSLVDVANDRFQHGDGKLSETDLVPPELRGDLANITSHYMGSIHHELGTDAGGDDTTSGYVYDNARFENPDQSTRAWLADLSKDPHAASQLTTASNLWMTDQITRRLHGMTDPADIDKLIHPYVQSNCQTLGAIQLGAGDDIRSDQVGADDAHNKKVDLSVGIASTILGETPVGKNPVTGFLLDQALSGVQDDLHQDHTGASDQKFGAEYSNTSDTVKSLIKEAYLHDLPPGVAPTEDGYSSWLQSKNPWALTLNNELSNIDSSYSSSLDDAKHRLENW